MKKLTKIFAVLFVIIAMFACVSTVLAEETEPVDVTYETPEDDLLEWNHTGELDKDDKHLVDGIDEEIEVIVDTNGNHNPDEWNVADVEVVPDGETEYDSDFSQKGDFDPLTFEETITVDPADLDVIVHPELGDEVENVVVEATYIDAEKTIFGWFEETGRTVNVDSADGRGFDVIDNQNGTWTVVTPKITYTLECDRDGWYIKWLVPKYDTDITVEDNYEKIYIHVYTKEMELDDRIKGKDGGLDLITDKLDIEVGQEAVIFDTNNVGNFVEDYYKVYEKNESLTFAEISVVVENLKGKRVEGVEATYDPSTGEVKITGISEGKYIVYLEGYYTDEQYEQVDHDVDQLRGRERGKKDVDYYRNGDVKVVYDTFRIGHGRNTKRFQTKDVYVLEDNSAWARFAKLEVNVHKEDVYAESGTEDTWVVVDESNRNKGQGHYDFKEEDYEGYKYYEVSAYEQKTDENGNTLPAEKIRKAGEPLTITIAINADEVNTPAGKHPVFTAFHKEKGPDTEINCTYTLVDGVYYVTFDASEFSPYAICWNFVNNPRTSYEFVNTGVDGTQQQVNVTAIVTMCAFALLVALKKRVSHC